MEAHKLQPTAIRVAIVWCHFCLLLALASSQLSEPRNATTGLHYFNRSDFLSWVQARLGQGGANTEKPLRLAPPSHHRPNSGYAIEVTPPPPPPPASQLLQYQIAKRNKTDESSAQELSPQSAPVAILSTNRSARTAAVAAATYDEQPEGADAKLLLSNTCERDHMLVEIKTSKPFHGLVHTLNYRRKLLCTAEGDGGLLLKLSISHSLNPSDPQHCGATRVAGAKAGDPSGELLSVIVAVRLNRNVELSEDRLFILNCTNHCRRPDCSSGPSLASGKLVNDFSRHSHAGRYLEREHLADEADLFPAGGRTHSGARNVDRNTTPADCSVWRPAWILALVLCLAIILVGMLISNCIICMSLRQKDSNKKQHTKQQREASDLESQQVDSRDWRENRRKSRRKSRQIIYHNDALDYAIERPEASARIGQADFLALKQQQQQQEKLKRSHVAPTSRPSGESSREHR